MGYAPEFCQQHGLALSTLRRHLKKQGVLSSKAVAGVRFMLLAGSRRIGLAPGFDVATLGRLVRALEGL